jgi:hypothetical protein
MKNRLSAAFWAGDMGLLASGNAFTEAKQPLLRATLIGFQEVPTVSPVATGQFRATIISDAAIAYEHTSSRLEGIVTQSHIHFGQKSVTGGISRWLCQTATDLDRTKLAPTCPQEAKGATTEKGMLTAANLLGPSGQDIAGGATGGTPEEFAEIVKAIRAGTPYANVRSSKIGSGEIRGQIEATRGERD